MWLIDHKLGLSAGVAIDDVTRAKSVGGNERQYFIEIVVIDVDSEFDAFV